MLIIIILLFYLYNSFMYFFFKFKISAAYLMDLNLEFLALLLKIIIYK